MPYVGRDLNRGNYLKLDDISSFFDGSETTFNLTTGGQAFYPGSAFSILVVLAGVIQEPESAYTINQSEITFAAAPGSSDDFFCIVLGVALGVGVPGNGTVNGTQLASPFSYDGFFYLNDVTNRVGINSSVPADTLDVNGNILPSFDATHDLGSASKRWNNVYTTDLQLSNEGSQNDVDGTWGRWTIQEGEDDLFLINRRNGKKYKFVLQEVN